MNVGSLFAGIGGFDLAAVAMGWRTSWFVEIDTDCQHWLRTHFPDRPIYGDITQLDFHEVAPVDILCGGFPCQPHSLAGKRGGSDDARDLWPEFARAIGVLRPRYVVGENVPGILTSDDGRMFNRVLSDLAACGYAVEWGCLSAAECGAPHKRERLWLVAYAEHGDGRRELAAQGAESGRAGSPRDGEDVGDGASGGRGAGTGEPVRRVERGRDGVGHAAIERCEGFGAGGQQESRAHGGARLSVRGSAELRRPWADAVPYRGADGTVRLIPKDALAGIEPALRALADGASDVVARRAAAEEVEAWPTCTQMDGHGARNRTSSRQHGSKHHDGVTLGDAVHAWPSGGALWPVTDSEPGRVARLKAIGNAVVPAWVLNGPFRRVAELERSR